MVFLLQRSPRIRYGPHLPRTFRSSPAGEQANRRRLGKVHGHGPLLAWLLTLLGIMGCAVEARAQDSATDREALVALYNATDGPNWRSNGNWLSERPLSEWSGVTATNGRVTRLVLHDNRLTGTIPSGLGNLTNLQSLSLDGNQLTGTIPPRAGQHRQPSVAVSPRQPTDRHDPPRVG